MKERHECVHLALSIAKLALQAGTLAAVAVAVDKLGRIHHRLKKEEKKEEKHHLL